MNNSNSMTILIIFGISGNLAQKKVLPALYALYSNNLLPKNFKIIGLSRREITIDQIFANSDVPKHNQSQYDDFKKIFQIQQFDSSDNQAYKNLYQKLQTIVQDQSLKLQLLFYLSIPPEIFGTIITKLGSNKLNQFNDSIQTRLLVEKPFGHDLTSAQQLIKLTNQYFADQQIFRIDHYLAKETVQNILIFRRYNPLFQTAWNNQHIASIEINTLESIDIEGRVDFYEHTGALRDQIQSHLFQLLTVTTMTLPTDLNNNDSIHLARHSLLANIQPMNNQKTLAANTFRAQYEGYKEEVNNLNSTTETFASIQLEIQNSIWKGVPIRLTTGKALNEKKSEIIINFSAVNEQHTNQLTFRLQPNEGIDICLSVKKPGLDQKIQTTTMDFSYKNSFSHHYQPDPYEKVLLDSFRGDNNLFATSNEIIDSWRILQPIIDYWQNHPENLKQYPKGKAKQGILC